MPDIYNNQLLGNNQILKDQRQNIKMSGPEDLPTPTNSQSTDGSDETARASTQDQTQFQFESHTGTLEVAMDASQNDEWVRTCTMVLQTWFKFVY